LDEEIERAKDSHEAMSLFLMDVDHFKEFNDEYGHPAGDSVLRTIAEILHRHSSAHFIPARYGGEEFVGMMPGMTEAAAAALADRVRHEIEAAYPTGRLVTASFGVASWQPGLRGKGELIARADKALYASKRAGRNRVTVASWLWAADSQPAA
jgi:diguanylate cyclase (GGDEF)-like protein